MLIHTSKRKAPSDDKIEILAKKRKNINIETDIPYAESSKNATKRKANEDINKEQQQKKSSKYLPFICLYFFRNIQLIYFF